MADSQFSYKPVTNVDLELFNQVSHDHSFFCCTFSTNKLIGFKHQQSIDKAVREKHSSIPADFDLKPVLARHIEACGTIHDYQVKEIIR